MHNCIYSSNIGVFLRYSSLAFMPRGCAHTNVSSAVLQEVGPLASAAAFVTGLSNGGFMASLLGMQPNSPFHAIAPVAGYQYTGYQNVSWPSMPIFQHHCRYAHGSAPNLTREF